MMDMGEHHNISNDYSPPPFVFNECKDINNQLEEVKEHIRNIRQRIDRLRKHEAEASLIEVHDSMVSMQEMEEMQEMDETSPEENISDWSTEVYPWSTELRSLIPRFPDITDLRGKQLHTMNATLSDRDVVLISATGSGKSLTYQLPGLIGESGLTLVISPLISLMEDQVLALSSVAPGAVAMLVRSSSQVEVKDVLSRIHSSNSSEESKVSPLRFLYITPEKIIQSKTLMHKLEKLHIIHGLSRIVIDECHCCSMWGHDFRTDYNKLAILKRQFPTVPILALTATATNNVLKDILASLNIPKATIFRSHFNRPNLFYEVRDKPTTASTTAEMIANFIGESYPNESGIIYTFSCRESYELAENLRQLGVRAVTYNGDLSAEKRHLAHTEWTSKHAHVIVATIAFGMGINLPSVRFVIHHSLPKSIESYYQESGRAGRDGAPATCLLLFRPQDVQRQCTIVYSERVGIASLHRMVKYALCESRCRRSILSQYFNEEFNDKLCAGWCDVCVKRLSYDKKSISHGMPMLQKIQEQSIANSACRTSSLNCNTLAIDVIKILHELDQNDRFVTLKMLVDSWRGVGPKELQVPGINPPPRGLLRLELERVILCLIVQDVLKEVFQHTCYSTNVYITLGKFASSIQRGHVIEDLAIDIPHNMLKSGKRNGSASTHISETVKKKR